MNQLILFDFTNGAFAQHALEILAMLLGAFAIGIWLGWAVWAKYKFQIDQKELDNQSNMATVNALREEIRTIREKMAASDAECTTLTDRNNSISRENLIGRLLFRCSAEKINGFPLKKMIILVSLLIKKNKLGAGQPHTFRWKSMAANQH